MIEVTDLAVRAGSFSLSGISFRVPAGRYAMLMGKTGSGKTTLLEAICGLKSVSHGSIVLAGRNITHHKPAERGIGFVPQDGALFNYLTVREHLAFALTIRRWDKKRIQTRVNELAEMLEIGHLLSRKPTGLSGGERQRVALGRALSFRPETLCLDEPLSALDDETRQHMFEVLRTARQHHDVTILHITHSLEEATALADCVLRIVDGSVTEDLTINKQTATTKGA